MQPEEIYLQNLRAIERIAAFVARRNHLNPDETGEFVQEVRVRLLDDDYAIIRKFEGRSLFSTYLTTCIGRLYHQWRVEQWGKWRPSAEAKRLGDKAVALERLLARDGYTFDEAVQVLTTPAGSRNGVAELESLYLRLPLRNPRPMLVSGEELPEVSVESDAEERVEARDRERTARVAARTIDDMLPTLEAEDRLILQMRFWHARKVPDIAAVLHLDQKKVYKRLDRLFVLLRRSLERAGVTKGDIARLLTRGDQEIHLDVFPTGEIGPSGHSHESGGKDVRGGEGRLP
jgi:RNA polymerase sigma factor (sigma-70 family)